MDGAGVLMSLYSVVGQQVEVHLLRLAGSKWSLLVSREIFQNNGECSLQYTNEMCQEIFPYQQQITVSNILLTTV